MRATLDDLLKVRAAALLHDIGKPYLGPTKRNGLNTFTPPGMDWEETLNLP